MRHKDRSAGFGSRLEAAPADLVEKHEPRDDVERQGWNGGPVDGKTAIREGRYAADLFVVISTGYVVIC